jgi:putative ABC transport system substrate-binding protein
MQRREFIKLVGGVAASWPLAAQAQQQTMPVIGYVAFTAQSAATSKFLEDIRKGLAEYGYVEGQNYRFEILETNFQAELRPILYRKLVDQKVTLIIAVSTAGVETAKAATPSIPIVFSIATDPVENGFVASLNKPGGNITGVFNLGVTLSGKRLEVLHELVPSVAKFAFLTDPSNTTLGKLQMQHFEAAANSFGLEIMNVYARNPDEFDTAFETAVRGSSGGMIIGSDTLFSRNSTQLPAIAARYRLPTIYVDEASVRAGGLINYSADFDESTRILGGYAGRILKGEKPADIPVQLSTKTKLIINLKAAKALGITVPMTLLGRADEVIE